MAKGSDEEVRSAWLRSTRAEAAAWLSHIDRRAQEIQEVSRSLRFPMFEFGELLFNVFAYLNWLAHIHFREANYVQERGHGRGRDMITWLGTATQWPLEPCEAFWFCLRNPVMHTGRTSIFADHDRKSVKRRKIFADMHPNLDFDPLRFQPDAFKPTPEQDGYLEIPSFEHAGAIEISFYFPGVRRKLDRAQTIVLEGIEEASHNSLMGLRKVNARTLAFRVWDGNDAPETGKSSAD